MRGARLEKLTHIKQRQCGVIQREHKAHCVEPSPHMLSPSTTAELTKVSLRPATANLLTRSVAANANCVLKRPSVVLIIHSAWCETDGRRQPLVAHVGSGLTQITSQNACVTATEYIYSHLRTQCVSTAAMRRPVNLAPSPAERQASLGTVACRVVATPPRRQQSVQANLTLQRAISQRCGPIKQAKHLVATKQGYRQMSCKCEPVKCSPTDAMRAMQTDILRRPSTASTLCGTCDSAGSAYE